MRSWMFWLVGSLFLATAAAAGCAASGNDGSGGSSSSTSGTGGAGNTINTGGFGGGGGGFEECVKFTAEGEQAPAAMLFVLDASASMANGGKWQAAQLAIVSAIDRDEFDSMSLGLLTFPSTTPVTGPACIFNLQVTCGYNALPQVPLNIAGAEKSNAGTGVRSQIYGSLTTMGPVIGQWGEDGSPIYDSLAGAYSAIKLYPDVDKRIVVLVTDGGFSCTSLSQPQRQAFSDANGCLDWEHPDNVNTLINQQRTDPSKPVNTFIVGVPGSDSNGAPVGGYDTPPYSMLLALSTYAVSGSPDTVNPACDSSLTFQQGAPSPAVPCHLDLSQGQLDASALATAIAQIRGQALGCIYQLPDPPPGEELQLDQVNVHVTVDTVTSTIPRRSDPNDTCEVDGCWDYTANSEVELIGKTCSDVTLAESAKVDIVVGCATVLK